MNHPADDISLRPLKKDISRYSWNVFGADLWAALSVAVLSIPQAIAFSIVVGLPPYCGLMATIFGTLICSLAGSSRHLIIGPNNTTILLVQSAIATIIPHYYPGLQEPALDIVIMQLIAALLVLIGLFQLAAGCCKMGRVIQFVSFPVVIGYILGSSVTIISTQLYTLFGIPAPLEEVSLVEKMHYLFLHINEIHPAAALVGILSFSILVTLKKMKFKAPNTLIMLLIMTPLVYLFQLHHIPDSAANVLSVVGDAGAIEAPIPQFQLPLFELRLLNVIVPIAFAIALISMLETTSIAKSIAANSGQHINVNQELFGLGAANFLLSFTGALPASGSLSRTSLNYENGAKTRFAGVYSSIIVAIVIVLFGTLIQYIPLSALAAIIMATAMRAVDRKHLMLCIRATHSDAVVFGITFFSCIFLALHIAFYIGVMLSIILYLRKAAIPEVIEYTYNPETQELLPANEVEKAADRKIRLINIEGELFFGSVDLFQSTLKAIAEDDTEAKVFVLRLKHVRDFDATAAQALKHLNDFLRKSGRYLIVTSIPKHIWHVLENARLVQHIGKDNLFLIDEKSPNKSVEQALERAAALS